ncbi:hypothetical protein [Saccharopolyspora halophila]|uniref:hypothetical protein n=1 Tax=Saccharopolyspora halophila TaxID=405551 RepID=UPI0031DB4433
MTPSSSPRGTPEWSWLPPGRTCTWQLPEGTHTDTPSLARVGIALLLILWGASLLLLRRTRNAA